jgi:hypothetical protein
LCLEIAKQSSEGSLIFIVFFPLPKIADVSYTAKISSPSLSCPFYRVIQLDGKEHQLFSLPFFLKSLLDLLFYPRASNRVL